MTTAHSLDDHIAVVERKIELRRSRTRRHWQEIQSEVQQIAERGAFWTPLIGVIAMAWFGFSLARQRGGSGTLVARPNARVGLWASLATLVTTALRIAFSPQGKQLWNAWQRRSRAVP